MLHFLQQTTTLELLLLIALQGYGTPKDVCLVHTRLFGSSSSCCFPSISKYLGTTSFDKTWRLWDTETASCGLDAHALAHVWDLGSGRSILALEGHVKPFFQVLEISFLPNGYYLATGGEDNTCRIWDLRKKRSLYTIPAHASLISQIKFEPQEGYPWYCVV
uniref:U4/U6 small nuclear ribonucleoprotein PRP4-like protein n=1 Tax=Erigeron canadensis TaxID=72917 RepID=UPI001CB92042|nr:U4/U6 small nuclear ribonucleoprotein PRP4-like protein [Erigeron canadensis]